MSGGKRFPTKDEISELRAKGIFPPPGRSANFISLVLLVVLIQTLPLGERLKALMQFSNFEEVKIATLSLALEVAGKIALFIPLSLFIYLVCNSFKLRLSFALPSIKNVTGYSTHQGPAWILRSILGGISYLMLFSCAGLLFYAIYLRQEALLLQAPRLEATVVSRQVKDLLLIALSVALGIAILSWIMAKLLFLWEHRIDRRDGR